MVYDVEHRRLNQLRLRNGRAHPNERFIGENNRTFRHGVNFPGKAELLQVGEEIFVEQVQRAQIVDILI